MRRIIFAAMLTVIAAAAGLAQTSSALLENKVLEAELALSQKPGLYMLIDSAGGRISLKARGIPLREWTVRSFRIRGRSVAPEPLVLVKKTALLPPRREKIKPGAAAGRDTFELEALELPDMPARYTLVLEKRTFIDVRPKAGGFFGILDSLGFNLGRFLLDPLKSVWAGLTRRPFTSLDIVLDNSVEAQTLYWTFTEGLKCVIY